MTRMARTVAPDTNAAKNTNAAPDTNPAPRGGVVFRSRYDSYRWGDVKFHSHVAVVDTATAARMKIDPSCGQGLDFWPDV